MHRSALLCVLLATLTVLGCGETPPRVASAAPPDAGRPAVQPEPSAPAAPSPPATPEPSATPVPATIRVLFVDGYARWENIYLTNVLTKAASVQAWSWRMDEEPEKPMPRSPGLPPIDVGTLFSGAASLAAFDVIVLGDVDASKLLPGADGATRALTSLRDFVEQGGGLALIAGTSKMPWTLRSTPLADAIPVEWDDPLPPTAGASSADATPFEFRVTQAGANCPFLDVAGDSATSRRMWETDPHWRQYWVFPARRIRPGASLLLEATRESDRAGAALPVAVSWTFGKGRVLFVGVDELWRMRYDVGDKWYGALWKGAVNWLRPAAR